ncbi:type II secretion system protein GspE [candidate division WWE3 bacterium CG_4_10_14_0_2_um_filter_41_14]|uniref:Type II secretion system protein GspE n=1 Tax=candidate division WWE3 bacterium CG_4_10_14_0_2_um_filter_41_14 TaxID=1975072 RepID=A0A2M7TF02_UNCKA|nr:MAG: type II secretion system protein GspE [candidate division WWE3 bacterium CG_4_10_14_0_2_um_filter_41_14]
MAQKTDLVTVLTDEGVLTEEKASQVRVEQITSGHSIEQIIVDKGWATELQIVKARAQMLSMPFVDVANISISADVVAKIPESVARHYTLIPVSVEGDALQVAMKDPLDLQVIEFLETKTSLNIKPVIAVPDDILRSINQNYNVGIEKEVTAALRETESEVDKVEKELKNLDEAQDVINSAPVARIVSTTLEYAMKSKASDVHIEPLEDRTRVRFRIDGVLRERLSLPPRVHNSVISRIKILSHLKIDEKRIPQDGRFSFASGKEEVDLRVSTLPTNHGEKVVMRLLRKSAKVLTLDELGMLGSARKNFKDTIHKSNGIILVTGPTGSGKTTTLRTALTIINSVETNISTLEDPVEYSIPGINQSQINPQAGFTFATGLRSLLRQDPDVIMVGEVRDKETMELAVQAALTGHLVFSTLHTSSAAGALPRLLDMGAEPFLLASTIQMIIAQRLVRTVNMEFMETYTPDEKVEAMIRESLGALFPKDVAPGKLEFVRIKADADPNVAYSGRVGIYEVLTMNEKISRLVLEHETADAVERQAIADGMVRMIQDGYLKAINKTTTLEEVLRVIQD